LLAGAVLQIAYSHSILKPEDYWIWIKLVNFFGLEQQDPIAAKSETMLTRHLASTIVDAVLQNHFQPPQSL